MFAALVPIGLAVKMELAFRSIARPITLEDGFVTQDSDKVDLRTCNIRPLVQRRGHIFPASEVVIFWDQSGRVSIAPSLLTESSQDALRDAWIKSGREFIDFYAENLQFKATPRY
ncbi:MAG: hypothetical protein ABL949_15590 [Fimbriimonadaceae bacterium]